MSKKVRKKQFNKTELVALVQSETGFSMFDCENIIDTFLNVIKDKSIYHDIQITNFGTIKTSMKSRDYYGFDSGKLESTTKPKIKFTPSANYLSLIKTAHGDSDNENYGV